MRSVTSQGHPHAIFQRAIQRRSFPAAWAAACDLGRLALADALALTLLALDQEPRRYPQLAARWLGRFALEARRDLDELALVVAHLAALRGDAAALAPAARCVHAPGPAA